MYQQIQNRGNLIILLSPEKVFVIREVFVGDKLWQALASADCKRLERATDETKEMH